MANVKVKLIPRGQTQLRNSKEMQAHLLALANQIKNQANQSLPPDADIEDMYHADVQPGVTRAHAIARTAAWRSRYDNAKNNTLLKALGSIK